jgi:response regulator of citrate/malate metabolism
MMRTVVNQEKIDRLVNALEEADGGPLMVREVAERLDVSRNTAGKYVDIAEATAEVVTDRYGTARRVWLPKEAPSESTEEF